MRSFFIAAALAAGLASGAARAADANAQFYIMGDPGIMTCGTLMSTMNDADTGKQLGMWIAGYVTALNRTTPETFHVLGGVEVSAFFDDMLTLCRKQPDALVEEAVFVAIEKAKPSRKTKAP